MPTPWTHPLLRRACAIEPANVQLALDASPTTRHYVALAARGFERSRGDAAAFAAFAHDLAFRKRRSLLAALFGADLGDPALLRKAGSRLWSRQAYDRFVRIASQPDQRAVLARLPRLSPTLLARLESAPPIARHAAAMPLVQALGAPTLAYLIAALRALRPDLEERAIVYRLSRAIAHDGKETCVLRLLGGRTLPPPPWPGTADARPMQTLQDLAAAGRDFRNCLGSLGAAVEASLGIRAFYRLDRPIRAVVALRHDALLGRWRIDEALAPGNRPLSPARRKAVLAPFVTAGFADVAGGSTLADLIGVTWHYP
jgi:hypothetical protein